MKKNLILFGILISLLGITYLVQEKGTEKKFNEELVRDKLYPGEISKISIAKIDAEKIHGQWKNGEELLSHNMFKLIEEKIHQLKKIKEVEGEARDFFSTPVEFKVNGEELILGDLSLDSKGFYLSQNGKIMLAVLEGNSREVVQTEEDLQPTKLNEFRALLTKDPKELRENQLFRYYPELPFEKITIKVPDTLPFELDFKENTTTPPPFPGVSPHENLSKKFLSLLTQVTLREEIPMGKFGSKLGEITFFGGGKAVMWELYSRGTKNADAVIVDPVRRKAWLMIGGTLKVFFIQLQDYWDKKNIPSKFFYAFDREPMIFTQGSFRSVVYLLNREPLGFETTGYKINQERMVQLVSYVLNLGPLDQASRMSLLSNTERKQILSEEYLQLEIFKQNLLFWVKKEELIIVNLTQGYKAHYPHANVSRGFQFQDVLE